MVSRRDARALLAIVTALLLALALLVVAFPLATQGVAADVCPEEGKVESVVDGDLDDVVLPAGTLVCIKAGDDLVEVVADGSSTLFELIGNGHNVSHYTILDETTTTTLDETTTTQSDEEPTTTTILDSTTTTVLDSTTTTIATTTTLGLGDVVAVCVGDIPFLSYAVTFPGAINVDIIFLNPSGVDLSYPDQPLSGQVLWPGASDVFPFDWPGWSLVDGVWVEADDGFLWAREIVTVLFSVNPTAEVQVAYPEATSQCANPPALSSTTISGQTLPFTGADDSGALSLTGAALVALGLLGLAASRTRSEK